MHILYGITFTCVTIRMRITILNREAKANACGSRVAVVITKFLLVWLASPVFECVEILLKLWVAN